MIASVGRREMHCQVELRQMKAATLEAEYDAHDRQGLVLIPLFTLPISTYCANYT
jgi:hypothetical protein